MNELILTKDLEMTSLEVVDLINKFRAEEGNTKVKKHDVLLRDIRNEIQYLKSCNDEGVNNFVESSYINSQNKLQPCYKLNRNAVLQIMNKESAVVRAKTIRYINALENRITAQQHLLEIQTQHEQIIAKDLQIQRLEQLIGLRTKDKFSYGKIIKEHLGIRKADDNYNIIKQMFFYELGVKKWEDIPYHRDNVKLLKEICESYKPTKQYKLF